MKSPRTIRHLLGIATIATLASAPLAWAYSDEAVKEAELVLQMVTGQYQAGVADQSDMSLARYDVLDMKYKAKSISQDAFCKAAKPELEIVAGRLKVGPEKVDEKQKWATSIAAMDTDHAKCRQAGAAAEILLFDAPRFNGSAASLKQAQAAARLAEDRLHRGLASPIDLAQAQYQLLVAELRAGKLARPAFCERAPALLQKIVAMFVEQINRGLSTVPAAFPTKRQLYATKAQCETEAQP
jgi:hypothetical protein